MRLAFVTARYGAEIAGGAEHACRLLAEQLSTRHDIDVITTCVRGGRGGRTEHAEGADRVRGVLVRRFATARGPESARGEADGLFTRPHGRADEIEWTRQTGPWSPGLLDYLKRHHRNYDALAFFSYRQATTVHGLAIAPERSMLFPWLELEPALRLSIADETLAAAAGIGYLSPHENRLLRLYTRAEPRVEEFVGIGVQPPPQHSYPRLQQEPPAEADAPDDEDEAAEEEQHWAKPHLTARGVPFRRRHRLSGRLVVYGGRVEPDNGCEEMIEYFDSYASGDEDASLVLLGVKMMKVPEERYLRLAGVLPPRERMAAYEAADVTAAPDPRDLLAETVLESFAAGTPVLVSARNEAAVHHVRRANAGLYYANRDEFVETLKLLVTNDRLRETMSHNAQQYVQQHFRWDAVIGRFERLLSRIKGR
jgi:glycosyltransferase involved in cell wall biosynthesis